MMIMREYRVVIPCAGIGSRLKGLSKHINKALVTVDNKPIISHIVEKFPESIEIVIALGYKGNTVRDYLEIAHPERKFIFVEVDKYEGEGAGLGHTLLSCKDHLQTPFVFCSNDTIVDGAIPEPDHNWMGYAEIRNTEQYRSLKIDSSGAFVSEICGKSGNKNAFPYIGLAGIRDYEEFWQAMEKGGKEGSIEIGESYGLKFLLPGIEALDFDWFDTGNTEALQKTREYFEKDNEFNILEKENEAIWFINGKVIKFSTNAEFINKRVARALYLKPYVPKITDERENMYAYKMVEGKIFSKNPKVTEFEYFLDWMDGFWNPIQLDSPKLGIDSREFQQVCTTFYKDKTHKRVKDYFIRFEKIDAQEIINGRQIPKVYELLDTIDWDYLSSGSAVQFHGDLHFENILINDNPTQPFTLLDWRQDFGGLPIGDIYYDFAKLYHGLIISHELITQELFNVEHKLNVVSYDFLRKQSLVDCEHALQKYVTENGYDWHKVELLTALIFLNIAVLHHYPYSLLLFYLGKNMLFNLLRKESNV